jgi:hypothetical protein
MGRHSGGEDPETVGVTRDFMPEPIIVHQVVGITRQEHDYARIYGSDKLWGRLLATNTPFLIDERVRWEI